MAFFFVLAFIFAVFFWTALWVEMRPELRPVGKKPLELPEWTGRERESLRADLEAAAEIPYPWDTWEEVRKYDWESIEETTSRHGLFPEALEAFMEGQKKVVSNYCVYSRDSA